MEIVHCDKRAKLCEWLLGPWRAEASAEAARLRATRFGAQAGLALIRASAQRESANELETARGAGFAERGSWPA